MYVSVKLYFILLKCVKINTYYFFKLEAFCDVTLAVDGASIKCHKMVLAACSSYFQNLFIENDTKHPIVFLKVMLLICIYNTRFRISSEVGVIFCLYLLTLFETGVFNTPYLKSAIRPSKLPPNTPKFHHFSYFYMTYLMREGFKKK